jgi:hypothetical protein
MILTDTLKGTDVPLILRGMELFNDHLNRDDHKETGTTDHGIVWADFEYWPEKPAD